MGIRAGFLNVLQHTLNPVALRSARSGRGPFSLIRHVGRKSGKTYETPLILAETADGLVCELTYGEDVAWYKNVLAAGGRCEVIHKGRTIAIDRMTPLSTEDGYRAFGAPRNLVLKLLRRKEFRLLHPAATTSAP